MAAASVTGPPNDDGRAMIIRSRRAASSNRLKPPFQPAASAVWALWPHPRKPGRGFS